MKYVTSPCGPWVAVHLDTHTPEQIRQHTWLAEALCMSRLDARNIAKRLNAAARKAFVIEKNKRARIAARNRSRR